MSPFLAALAASMVVGGLFLALAGFRRVPRPPARPARRGGRRAPQRSLLVLVGVVVGVVAWLVTGWPITVLVAPTLIAGVPWLLATPPTAVPIARLEAMEEWTRSLAGVLTVGIGLEQAIAATRRSAPAAIRSEVDQLAARLSARWSTETALRAFADDLDDSTGDLIAASLVLAARRRGGGLTRLLNSLADTATAELRVRRAIETDRAKPRAAARWITVLTTGFLIILGLVGSALEPYGTPVGQVILVVLLTAFVGCLVALRQLTTGERLPRLLGTRVRRPVAATGQPVVVTGQPAPGAVAGAGVTP